MALRFPRWKPRPWSIPLDLTYLSDVLTRRGGGRNVGRDDAGPRSARIADMETLGLPLLHRVGRMGGVIRQRDARTEPAQAIADGYRHVKLKVGANLDDDIRRCTIAREVIGSRRPPHDRCQSSVGRAPRAIEWVNALADVQAVVDRRTDQPRRRPRPRRGPKCRGSDRGGHR